MIGIASARDGRDRTLSLCARLAAICLAAGIVVEPARAGGDADGASVCPDSRLAGRTVVVDNSSTGLVGSMTSLAHDPHFLGPKEVVLTFDDGPMPWVTDSILDTLDTYCAKATFFSVGRMALAYPSKVKEILAKGHTLGSHTFSHPLRMPALSRTAAEKEIEMGLAAVATAAGTPVAPFFRFPGLSASHGLIEYLKARGLIAFTVDVVSNDSYIHDPGVLTQRTIAAVELQGGGIILFHDIKTATAKALPGILSSLREKGYKVVHMMPGSSAVPMLSYMAELAPEMTAAPNGWKAVTSLSPREARTRHRLQLSRISNDAHTAKVAGNPSPAHASRGPKEASKRGTERSHDTAVENVPEGGFWPTMVAPVEQERR